MLSAGTSSTAPSAHRTRKEIRRTQRDVHELRNRL
jgi:hypothetical protein